MFYNKVLKDFMWLSGSFSVALKVQSVMLSGLGYKHVTLNT